MTAGVVGGSGIAGLTAALHAAESGCRVTVVTKGTLHDTNTRWAQVARSIAPPTAGMASGAPVCQLARSPLAATWKAPRTQ